MTENKEKIIGQNEAIEKVGRAIRRNRVGLKDPGKPIGSFIFSRAYWSWKNSANKSFIRRTI